MPTILSGAVLQTGSSSSFIKLSEAQPALQVTPSTNTGFTLILTAPSAVEYSNILGNITFDQGSLTNYFANQDISISTPGGGVFQVYSPTFLNNVLNVTSTASDAFNVYGGGQIAGILNVNSNIGSTGTQTGSLIVHGGVGVSENLYAGAVYDSGTRVISHLLLGPGLSESTSTGPTVVLTNTGVLSLTAGTGTAVSNTTGNITFWVNPFQNLQSVTDIGNVTQNQVFFNNSLNALSTLTGSVVVAGGIGVGQDVYIGGKITASNLSISDGSITARQGTFRNLSVTSTDYSTTTFSNNALYVKGGVGIQSGLTVGGNTLIYGNLTVLGTYTVLTSQTSAIGRSVIALSTSTAPAITDFGSGITVGPVAKPYASLLFNGIDTWISQGGIEPSLDLVYNLGNSGLRWNNIYSGNLILDSGAQSFNTQTGALIIQGGLGLSGNVVTDGEVYLTANIPSVSTETGTLIVEGGAGIGGSVYAGNIYSNGILINPDRGYTGVFAGTDTAISTSLGVLSVWNTSTLQSITSRGNTTNYPIVITNTTTSVSSITGALLVSGGAGIGGSAYVGKTLFVYGTSQLSNTIIEGDGSFPAQYTLKIQGGGSGSQFAIGTSGDPTFGIANDVLNSAGNGYSKYSLTASEIHLNVVGNVTQPDAIYIDTNGVVNLTGTTISNSTTTGALVIAGGLGIQGVVNAGTMYSYGSRVVTVSELNNFGVTSLTAGTGTNISSTVGNVTIWNNSSLQLVTDVGNTTNHSIGITNATSSTSVFSGALTVAGGVGIGGGVYIGQTSYIANAQIITTATVNDYATKNTLTAGTDTAVSTSTGNITIWNTATLQSVTSRGNTTDQVVIITNTTTSTGTTTGALIVAGGVSIGGNLYINGSVFGNSNTSGTATNSLNVFVTGTNTNTNFYLSFVNTYSGFSPEYASTGLVYNPSTKEVKFNGTSDSTTSTEGALTVSGGLGLSKSLVVGGTSTHYGSVAIKDSTPSTSVSSGALTVTGGVGIGGNLYISGKIVAQELDIQLTTITTTLIVTDDIISTYNTTNAISTTTGALQVAGGAGIGGRVYIGQTSYIDGSQIITTATVNDYATRTVLIAGTDTAVSTSTGNITIWDTATLQSITSRGNTTNNFIRINNDTPSGGTSTGALVVSGGVGIWGSLYLGDTGYVANSEILTTATISRYAITSLLGGTDTAVSSLNGVGRIWDTSTLDSVTRRGRTSTNAILISNSSVSSGVTSGALVVTGGVGIGQALYVNDTSYVNNAEIITTATVNQFAVTGISAGTDTAVSLLNGIATIWDIATLQSITGRGNSTTSTIFINNKTGSNSTNTGALTVAGGVGLAGGLYVGQSVTATNNIYVGTTNQPLTISTNGISLAGQNLTFQNVGGGANSIVIGNNSPTVITGGTGAGTGITLDAGSSSGTVTVSRSLASISTTTGALVVRGGLGIGGAFYANTTSYIASAEVITTATVYNFVTKTSLTAGTDTAVSTSTGDIVIWNTSTLQTVTDRGNTTNNAIAITNNTTSTGISSGALTVLGGVGISGGLYVNRKSYISNAEIITTSTINQFAATSITAGTDTAVSTSTGNVVIWNTSTLQTVTDRNNTTTNFIVINNVTASTSTTTGALIVRGGVGIGQALYVNTTSYVAGSQIITTATVNQFAITAILAGTDTSVSTSSGIATIWNTATLQTITDRGTTTTNAIRITNSTASTSTTTGALVVRGGVGLNAFYANTTSYIDSNEVVTSATIYKYVIKTVLTAGTDTAVSTSTGNITIWNTSTLQTVTDRGYITNNPIVITNATTSTNTLNGALIVAGGAGISGDLNVGGTARIAGDLYVDGTNFVVDRTRIETGDATIALSNTAGSPILAVDSGITVGLTATPYISWFYDGVDNWKSSGGIVVESTGSRALSVAGGAKISGAIIGATGTTNVSTVGFVTNNATIATYVSPSFSSQATQYLDIWSTSSYRTAKYLIQLTDAYYSPARVHVTEMVIFHDGAGRVYKNEYGIFTNVGELGTFDTEITGSGLQLTFTPNSVISPTSLVIKVYRTSIGI
jgi:hypothetical protein